MKIFISLAVALALLAGLTGSVSAAPGAKKLEHVVALKFKADATPEQIKKVETEFRALKKKISQVVALEWGTDVSPEKKAKGFTHCFILSFASESDRDTYVAHAAHKAFVEILKPVLDDVFVIDFWAQE